LAFNGALTRVRFLYQAQTEWHSPFWAEAQLIAP